VWPFDLVWLKSDVGVSPYHYIRTANQLDRPATYRIRVGYRWYGKHGRVLRTTHSRVLKCHQVDLRPDLRIRSIIVLPGKRGKNRYAVVVRNAGLTGAGAFALRLSFPNGASPAPFVFGHLGP